MKLRYKTFIYNIILLLLTIGSGAKAQIIWHMTHSGTWISVPPSLDSLARFTSISCNGKICTASAIIYPFPPGDQHISFFRSNDGGRTWYEQPTGLTLPSILTNSGIIKIQQIDSLNVVGIADQGTLLRTFDGGKTWLHQQAPTPYTLTDVSFSDPKTGIACGGGVPYQLFVTHDSGRSWSTPFAGVGFNQCHCYGNGKFRFFEYGYGPVYSTTDNFKTVDSTGYVFDSIVDPHWYWHILTRCAFGGGDTMLAYGNSRTMDTTVAFGGDGIIMRSLDGGKHWEKPYIYPTIQISTILNTSPIDRDTIYAGGFSNCYYLVSTNRGKSWQVDTTIIDTSYTPYCCFGLALPPDGHPIGIFSTDPASSQSMLTRAIFPNDHVEYIDRVKYFTYIYPNPASEEVTISSIEVSKPIYLIDMLGRVITNGLLSDQGKLRFDVSRLSGGIYEVLIDDYGQRFSIGKIAVISK